MTHAIKLTEAEAIKELIGRLAITERPTPAGTEIILGRIAAPLFIEETGEGEEITAATIEGEIIETRIRGLPGAIAEGGIHARLELIPISAIEFL